MAAMAAALSVAVGLCCASLAAARAGDDDHAGQMIGSRLTLPAIFRGVFGMTYRADLEALMLRPYDDRRHPLAVINHGMTTEADERREMRPDDMLPQAIEFVRRGWAVLIPMRRAYGKSGGHFSEDITGTYCGSLGFEDEGRAAAEDIKEAIRLVAAKPYLDMSKIISVCVSGGGYATVALTADPPPHLVAGISFAGGEGSSHQGMYCSFSELVQSFAHFGRHSHVPMLWVYAQNDHFFGPGQARDFAQAFNAAGGSADLQIAAAFEDEGHYLFGSSGVPIWTKYVDDFLAAHHLEPEPMSTFTPVKNAKASP
jgi:dienelactone hydrolase